jgi:sugar phosphate isomerase/epimerase
LKPIFQQHDITWALEFVKLLEGKVYSIHTRYESFNQGLEDVKLAKLFGAKVVVLHTDYPKKEEELLNQVLKAAKVAVENNVTVCLENLADRKKKAGHYEGCRNPTLLADALEKVNCPLLGMCLDTGHAMSNAHIEWDTPNIQKWLKHVHYHSTSVGNDDHSAVTENHSEFLTEGFLRLLNNCQNIGIVVLENDDLAEAEKTQFFLRSRGFEI